MGPGLHLESRRGQESRRYLLDFGFTPDVYANNLDLLKIDVGTVDALILSHGHYDHVGGLLGFLEAYRPRMRKDLRLYTGGEDNFCSRFNRGSDGSFTNFGTPLDRRRLRALDIESVLSEAPIIIEGHAFTTGAVPRTSIEHVLPNTWVEYGVRNGLGCDAGAYMNDWQSRAGILTAAASTLPSSRAARRTGCTDSGRAGWGWARSRPLACPRRASVPQRRASLVPPCFRERCFAG